MLVGSAIGDAMGAPTEMWPRQEIVSKFGFVTGLDSVIRDVSPEGVWIKNMPPGGTTDDTRWKKLIVEYLVDEPDHKLDPKAFSQKILHTYDHARAEITPKDSLDSLVLEQKTLPVLWLHEWAKAANPFVLGDFPQYQDQLSTFYGGEMVCAGLLYGPAIGAFFPVDVPKAYNEAFNLALFDIGYARDITALSAAWTSLAMNKEIKGDSMVSVIEKLDPKSFSEARLVGRTAQRILRHAQDIDRQTRESFRIKQGKDSTFVGFDWTPENLQPAYALLDKHLQDMPFHAGEIYLQVLTAMLVADFDFEKTLQFLVNYGRDNDTSAAIAGAILGARTGFKKLPDQMKQKVLEVNKEKLGIDLEELACKMNEKILRLHTNTSYDSTL
ncbi:hypothetical protein C943_04467 [Mariniradius saccharolyticus AK6]|uniref:ADP-ribosylglycohydrolase n=1 Tax=Mariniradius saccharolyticus AK6 TaxID=1239962 RepID=M7XGB1_9BACT|nr:ADP-ribosylglycohydrolase family protein [Mariniradius saccharolyticus]EMS33588.1 hypothetical protein C943_04467 [Mariniradius saccharolyticus AK6]